MIVATAAISVSVDTRIFVDSIKSNGFSLSVTAEGKLRVEAASGNNGAKLTEQQRETIKANREEIIELVRLRGGAIGGAGDSVQRAGNQHSTKTAAQPGVDNRPDYVKHRFRPYRGQDGVVYDYPAVFVEGYRG